VLGNRPIRQGLRLLALLHEGSAHAALPRLAN
jgi:hypothetical protein